MSKTFQKRLSFSFFILLSTLLLSAEAFSNNLQKDQLRHLASCNMFTFSPTEVWFNIPIIEITPTGEGLITPSFKLIESGTPENIIECIYTAPWLQCNSLDDTKEYQIHATIDGSECESEIIKPKASPESNHKLTFSTNCNLQENPTKCWVDSHQFTIPAEILTANAVIASQSERLIIANELVAPNFEFTIANEGTYFVMIYSSDAKDLIHIQEITFYIKPTVTLVTLFGIIEVNSIKVIFSSNKEGITTATHSSTSLNVAKYTSSKLGIDNYYYFSFDINSESAEEERVYSLDYNEMKIDLTSFKLIKIANAVTYRACNLSSKTYSFEFPAMTSEKFTAKLTSPEPYAVQAFTPNGKIFTLTSGTDLQGIYALEFYYDFSEEIFFTLTVTFTRYTLKTDINYYVNSNILLTAMSCELLPIQIKLNGIDEDFSSCTHDVDTSTMTCALPPAITPGNYDLIVQEIQSPTQIQIKSITDLSFTVSVKDNTIVYGSQNTIIITSSGGDFNIEGITEIIIENQSKTVTTLTKTDFTTPTTTTINWNKMINYGDIIIIKTLKVGIGDKIDLTIDNMINYPKISVTPDWFLFSATEFKADIELKFTFASPKNAEFYMSMLFFGSIPITECDNGGTEIVTCTYSISSPSKTDKTINEIKVKLSGSWEDKLISFDLYPYSLTNTCLTTTSTTTDKVTFELLGTGAEPDSTYFSAKLYKTKDTPSGVASSTKENNKFTWDPLLLKLEGNYMFIEVKRTKDGAVIDNYTKVNINIIKEKVVMDPLPTIYALAKQNLIIEFITEVKAEDFENNFILNYNDNEETNKITFPCSLYLEGEATTTSKVQCDNIDTSKLDKNLSYKLSWINKCDAPTFYHKDLNLEKNTISTVTPKVHSTTTTLPITIELMAESIKLPDNISLINQDQDGIIITLVPSDEYNFDINNPKSIILKTDKVSEEGKYIIQISDETEIIDNTKSFIVISSIMTAKESTKTFPLKTKIEGMEISFIADIFASRIGKISLYMNSTPDTPIATDITCKLKTGDKTTILLISAANPDLALNSVGVYTLEIVDNGDENSKTVDITMNVLSAENIFEPLITQLFIIETNPTKPFEISFTEPKADVSFIKTISPVDSEGKGITFTITKVEDGLDKKYNLFLSSSITKGYGRYNGIEFFDSSDGLLFTLNENIIIMNEAGLPTSIPIKSIPLRPDNTFDIKFDKIIYKEYESSYKVTNSGLLTCTFSIIEEDLTLNKLQVHCNFPARIGDITQYNFDVTFMEKSLTTDGKLTLTTCDEGNYWDTIENMCRPCSDKQTVWDGLTGKCEECSIIDGGSNPLYEVVDGVATCVKKCNELNGAYEGLCYVQCPPTVNNKPQFIEDGLCVEMCSLGKGIKDTYYCADLLITKVSNLYETTAEQTFTIILNSIDVQSSITSFQLALLPEETTIYPFSIDICPYSLKTNSYECRTDVLKDAKKGSYKMYWIINEDIKDITGYATVIMGFITLQSFTPEIVHLDENNQEVTLTYSDKFIETDYTIKLFDTERTIGNAENSIDTKVPPKIDNNKVVLTFTSSFYPEGFFTILTKGKYNYQDKTNQNLLIIYRNLNYIKSPSIDIPIDKPIPSITIIMNDRMILTRLIEMVCIPPTGSQITINPSKYSLHITDAKKLIINTEEIVFDQMGEYTFSFTYKPNPSPLLYKLISSDLPSSGTFYPEVLLYKLSSPLPKLIITLDKPIDIALYGKVKGLSSTFEFTLAHVIIEDLQSYTLTLIAPVDTTKAPWGKITGIEFYKKDNTIPSFTITHNIIIVDETTFPQTIVSKDHIIYIEEGKTDFVVLFKESIYEEYFTANNNLITVNMILCTLAYEYIKNNNAIRVTCESPLIKDSTFNLISFGTTLRVLTIKTECIAPMVINKMNQCDSCSNIDATAPNYYKGKCYTLCPGVMIIKANICYASCKEIPEFVDFPYIQKKTCVKKCDDTYFKDETNKICYAKCPSELFIDEALRECVSTCPENTEPDADKICRNTEECLLYDSKGQCLTECPKGTVYDDWQLVCTYIIPVSNDTCSTDCKGTCTQNKNRTNCLCSETTYGVNCEYQFTETNTPKAYINKIMSMLVDPATSQSTNNLTDVTFLMNVLSLGEYLTQNPKYINEIKQEHIHSLAQDLLKQLNSVDEMEYSYYRYIFTPNIVPHLSFVMKAIVLKVESYTNQLRLLQGITPGDQAIIDKLSSNIKLLLDSYLKQYDRSAIIDDVMIWQDTLGMFRIYKWKNNNGSIKAYYKAVESLNKTQVNTTEFGIYKNLKLYSIIALEFPSEVATLYNTNHPTSDGLLLSIFDISGEKEITFVGSPDYNPVISIPLVNHFNSSEFIYYAERGIDILNPNDPAFTNSCYFNYKLDYDLTQNYRKYHLYANKTIYVNTGCKYLGYNSTNQKFNLQCEITASAYYTIINDNLKLSNETVIENLPTTCGGSIMNIENNFAFWIFTLVLSVYIIGLVTLTILNTYECLKNRLIIWLTFDDLILDVSNPNQSASQIQIVKNVEDVRVYGTGANAEGNPEHSNTRKIFVNNFLKLHPIICLFYHSVLCPMTYKHAIFVFNTLSLFGWNAILYDENMIESKIHDTMRNNFIYPMKKEFEKIICSIAITMGFTIIIKIITVVSIETKDELIKANSEMVNIDLKYKVCQEFWRRTFLKRLISYIFMTGILVFLYYYSVVFCGIYVNTQYGWFYSGLWSLLFNWIIFAPVSIIVISSLEVADCNSGCSYYSKQIFWF